MAREITAPTPAVLSSKSYDGKHTIQFSESSHRYKLDGKACVGVTTFIKASYPTGMGLIQWMKGQSIQYIWNELMEQDPNSMWWNYKSALHESGIADDRRLELFKEAKAADKKASQEAADVGTVLHALAEFRSRGKVDEADALLAEAKTVSKWPEIKSCYEKYLDWESKNTGKFLSSEQLIASPEHVFCGKYDLLSERHGRIVLSDYKTSSGIFSEQKIQLAAYRLALKSWLNIDVDALEILRFGKADGEFETCFIDAPLDLKKWQDQAIRCRETYELIRTEER